MNILLDIDKSSYGSYIISVAESRKFKIIDVFSGVGGLSLGAARAGFDVACSIEKDQRISSAHMQNFPHCCHFSDDVSMLSYSEILSRPGIDKADLAGVIGGPPCQGFSSIGKKNPDDPRNYLLPTFFQLVSDILPPFYIAENVPGIMHERNIKMVEFALSLVPDMYVKLEPLELRASDFGAPTSRTRIFFIGYNPKEVNAFTSDDILRLKKPDFITVREAFSGIPNTRSHWKVGEETWRKVRYAEDSEYVSKLKGCIPKKVGDKMAIKRLLQSRLVSGFIGTLHSPETKYRYGQLPLGKRDPISRSDKLEWDKPCRTLRAGTGPEKGSFQAVRPIHPKYPRVITPREAARLQGFPDWFTFDETIWHSFRMIGNSVSPILAEAILSVIHGKMKY